MQSFKEGQTVIITRRDDKEVKHQVGVVVKKFRAKNRTFYDVLLENRSAISCLTSATSNNVFINRDLTKQLCEQDEQGNSPIRVKLDYQALLEADLIPNTRA